MRRLLLVGLTLGCFFVMSTRSKAVTSVALGGSTVGSITVNWDGVSTFTVTLSGVLSGPGYEFDSTAGSTTYTPAGLVNAPFSSSTQTTALHLGGGVGLPVSWTLFDGDGVGLILAFTTPLSPLADDLVLNSNVTYTGVVGPPKAAAFTLTTSVQSGSVYVPEPATLTLFGTGLIGLGGLLRRKMRKS